MYDLQQMIKEAGFEYVNGLINDHFFPVPEVVNVTDWKLIPLNSKIRSLEAKTKKAKGYRHANVYELVLWKKNNPEEVPDNTWIIALGQTVKPNSKLKERVPFINTDNDITCISLGFFDNEWQGREFLLVVKE